MSWQEEALTRLASLIEYGGEALDYGTGKGYAHFFGWRAQAMSALQAIIGENDVYTVEFKTRVNYDNGPNPGIELLRRLHSDIENGYLRKTANIISSEVFDDFLEWRSICTTRDIRTRQLHSLVLSLKTDFGVLPATTKLR